MSHVKAQALVTALRDKGLVLEDILATILDSAARLAR